MALEAFLNGAGPLVAVCAIPMILGLVIRRETLAARFRRYAILLALALPIVFMVLVGVLALTHPGAVPFDFGVNHDAANLLYGQGRDPYSIPGVYSFPFPTFLMYWIAGGFGALNNPQAWIAWWVVNGTVWAACAVLLWRTLAITGNRERDLLIFALVGIPAMTTLWQGQTALLILAGLVTLQLGLSPVAGRVQWIAGGIGLAFAALIKPQMALIGIGLALWAIVAWRSGRTQDARCAVRVLVTALAAGLVAILLTVIIPGGVTVDTYLRFFNGALPQVAQPIDLISVNGSPAYALSALALSAGLSASLVNIISNAVTLLLLAVAAVWTVRRQDRPITEIAAGWGVWAMVTPRVAWTWYATWCLPFFLLAIQENRNGPRWRLTLIVLILGALNLQIGILPIALGTIITLIALVWTSFGGAGSVNG